MRIRTIKPEFWLHEGMSLLSPLTRLLAIGLLNWADDEGYFLSSPKLLRGAILPFEDDSSIIPRMLMELSSVGWIALGKDAQGRDVGHIINFSKHQRVDRPQKTKIEGFTSFDETSANVLDEIEEQSTQEGKGGERKGKDSPKPPKGARTVVKEETPKDPRHQEFIAIWDEIYFERVGEKCIYKPREFAQLSDFLEKATGVTGSQFRALIRAAKEHADTNQYCIHAKKATSLGSLAQNYSEIREELVTAREQAKNTSPTNGSHYPSQRLNPNMCS